MLRSSSPARPALGEVAVPGVAMTTPRVRGASASSPSVQHVTPIARPPIMSLDEPQPQPWLLVSLPATPPRQQQHSTGDLEMGELKLQSQSVTKCVGMLESVLEAATPAPPASASAQTSTSLSTSLPTGPSSSGVLGVFTVSGAVQGKLRVQIASDLHSEMWHLSRFYPKSYLMETVVNPAAPVLALLGDIGCPALSEQTWEDYQTFLALQASRFELVLVLAGNHEYYSSAHPCPLTVAGIRSRIRQLCGSLGPHVVFLDDQAVLVNGVRIAGSTLWTNVTKEARARVQESVSDYSLIFTETTATAAAAGTAASTTPPALSSSSSSSSLAAGPASHSIQMPMAMEGGDYAAAAQDVRRVTIEDTIHWHHSAVSFLSQQAREAKRSKQRMLVLTHHAPTFQNSSAPAYEHSPIGSAFCTSLEHMMDWGGSSDFSTICAWAFGHTHWVCDHKLHGVRIVSNQHGYAHSDANDIVYDPEFVMELATNPPIV